MRHILWLLGLCVAIVLVVVPARANDVSTPQIVGGEIVVPNSIPWQVLLQIGGSRCGGSLIHPEWVLTAAHCVQGRSAAQITAYLGVHDKNTLTVGANQYLQTISAATIIMHPSYNPTTQLQDIALIRLSSAAALTAGVQEIPIADTSHATAYQIGSVVVMSGWGITNAGVESQFLQRVTFSLAACGQHASQLCTATLSKSPCNGDSGGPLTGQSSGTTVLAGIASYTDGATCLASSSAVYTKVASYADWVRSIVPIGVQSTATPEPATATNTISASVTATHTPTLSPTATYVQSNAQVGMHSSLVLTKMGMPIMSYYASDTGNLMLAVCQDVTCASVRLSVLDESGDVGRYSALAVTSTGDIVVAYYDTTQGNLKYLWCRTMACNNRSYVVLDAQNNVGGEPRIALSTTGIPTIVYFDYTGKQLKLLVCDTVACQSPTKKSLAVVDQRWSTPSLAITSDNRPVTMFLKAENSRYTLTVAICNNAQCTAPNVVALENVTQSVPSYAYGTVELTSTNLPVLSYIDASAGLKIVRCTVATCATRESRSIANLSLFYDTALRTDNRIVTAYYQGITPTNADLKMALCDTASCASAVHQKIDTTGYLDGVYTRPSLALTSSFMPVMSYYDFNAQDLKIAICQNTACTTVIRRVIDGSTVLPTATATVTRTARRTATQTATQTVVPGAFVKLAPANLSTNQPTSVRLTWGKSLQATSYEYCISLTKLSCTVWKSAGTQQFVAISGLTKNTSYFWNVRAKNARGSVTLSTGGGWVFKTAP